MSSTMIAHGVLRPDGWIQLLDPTNLPLEECEVEVSLTVSKPTGTLVTSEPPQLLPRLPTGFWPDESISAPFDLPRYGMPRPIQPIPPSKPHLPDSVFITIGEEVLE